MKPDSENQLKGSATRPAVIKRSWTKPPAATTRLMGVMRSLATPAITRQWALAPAAALPRAITYRYW